MPGPIGSVLSITGKAASGGGGNGLLNGLTEAWRPDATKAMIGQKTGLNTNTDAGLSYVDQAGFPGGKALQNPGIGSVTLYSAANALLSNIGNTDFLAICWLMSGASDNNFPGFSIGLINNNGFIISNDDFPLPSRVYAYLGGPTTGTTLISSDYGEVSNTPLMIALWYTTADSTLHTSVNAGTVSTIVNSDGIGAQDLTNTAQFSLYNAAGTEEMGSCYLWQGTAGVANAVFQLATLYGSKLQYSDFT
jgi:hypothetical protein